MDFLGKVLALKAFVWAPFGDPRFCSPPARSAIGKPGTQSVSSRT
jgi:hypothetical protein